MNAGEIQSHFDNIAEKLIQEIEQAQHTIFVAVAWFNSIPLLEALERCAQRKVSVQVIVSGSEKNEIHRYRNLVDAGGEIYIVGSKNTNEFGFMHNKFCVIDHKKVVTGSFNWSRNAGYLQENIVIISDEKTAWDYAQKCTDLIKSGKAVDFDESNSILISFFSLKTRVDRSQSVQLEWKVENATEVSISGIGSGLSLTGSHSVPVHEDTVFVLTAKEGDFQKSKTVVVRTVRYPKIKFFRSSEKAIVRGGEFRLSWSVENAHLIEIQEEKGKIKVVGAEGNATFSPSTDTLYTLTAHGETRTVSETVKLIVFPLPTVKNLYVPLPTKISLECNIRLSHDKVPSSPSLDALRSDIYHRVPKIELLRAEIFDTTPTIQDLADALGKEVHQLALPKKQKKKNAKSVKNLLFDRLQELFKKDMRASRVISQIRKTYDI